ncbi:hypothetical protein [Ancylobacter oerskovii]|uniref:HEPN AbiU2-like domain-containing protein n=1 Tax=Ancylobacter oerskovii TaxID=459519 RepID=A0ABW4YYS6_9HYPH|nr:hypothetical protein [Ancylobacter oerskovii]MBS7544024.1 hypothetical protein [Ancylobacter oerskovii]
MSYEFEIDRCDVQDKSKLGEFRRKRDEWLHWMRKDEHHSICQQITGMLWNDAVFRMVNEARRLAAARNSGTVSVNASLMRMVDEGFVATQVLAIRRLREPPSRDANKQVISLKRTLLDITTHLHLFTREAYVCFDGLPYDPEPGRTAYFEWAKAQPNGAGMTWLSTSGPEAWTTSCRLHDAFDHLSGTTPSTRNREDTIRPEVLTFIDQQLEDSGWKDISDFANKFVAHSADRHSRSLIQPPRLGVSLNELERCHRAICQVTSVILSTILYDSSYGFFPVPQFDALEHLERPLIETDDMGALVALWDSNIARVGSWGALDLSKAP